MAGVSQSTVSRALRDEPGISRATKQRVSEAARALGYVRIERGLSLSTRLTRRVGIVVADLNNPFYPELVQPLRAELERLGYRALLVPDPAAGSEAIDRLADGSFDGLVMLTAELGSPLPHMLVSKGVPVVLLNRSVDGWTGDSCVVDDHRGGLLVANLFADLGHDSLAAIVGPSTTSTSRDREAGFRDGLAARGLVLPPDRVIRGEFSHDAGQAAMLALVGRKPQPTAVFCANDVIATGAISALVTRNIRPGTDISVVGFDDIVMSHWGVFALSTVRGGLAQLAREGARILVERLRDPAMAPQRVVLEPELVLRSSHGRRH